MRSLPSFASSSSTHPANDGRVFPPSASCFSSAAINARLHLLRVTRTSAAARRVGNVLRQLGGEGTPGVQDFCLGEIAIARGAGVTATINMLADVLDLEQALVLSPSSYGLQPWRFVVVNDPAVRKRVFELVKSLTPTE